MGLELLNDMMYFRGTYLFLLRKFYDDLQLPKGWKYLRFDGSRVPGLRVV